MRFADHIVVESVDGQSLLLDLQQNAYFSLNSVGKIVADRIQRGDSAPQIQEALERQFPDSEPQELLTDLRNFITELKQAGILVEP